MSIVARSNDGELKKQLQRSPNGEGDTAQGFYIIGADGKLYGWNNTHYIPNILRFMDSALDAFRHNPPEQVEISQEQAARSYSIQPDSTTSIVQIFTRVSPLPAACDELNRSVGRDYMWIYADDVEDILSTSESASAFPLPRNLVARLVRFHLIDNVRGEPDEWESSDVKLADFSANLVGTNEDAKHFVFHGKYSQETSNHGRGQEGTLDGEFDILTATKKMANFRAFGKATVWGESTFTPGAPKGKFGLLTAMIPANDAPANLIAPHAVWDDGKEYHAPDLTLTENPSK